MKRYPHSAILTIRAEPEYVNSNRLPDKPSTVKIVGRYDADGKTVKKNPKGDEVIIAGCFYVRGLLPPYNGYVVSISISSLNINEPVFDIQPWQSHLVISIANSVR